MQRRRFLGGLGAAAVGGLAGCGMLSNGSGGGTPAPLSAVEGHLVSPVDEGGIGFPSVSVVDLQRHFEIRARQSDTALQHYVSGVRPDATELDRQQLQTSAFVVPNGLDIHRVVRGSFEAGTVVGALESSAFDREGEVGEYALFTHPISRDRWLSVDDDTLVWSDFGTEDPERMRRLLDAIGRTVSGSDPGFLDREGPHQPVLERLPSADSSAIDLHPPDNPASVPGELEGVLASGQAETLHDPETAEAYVVYEFESETARSTADIAGYADRLRADGATVSEIDSEGTSAELQLRGHPDVLP